MVKNIAPAPPKNPHIKRVDSLMRFLDFLAQDLSNTVKKTDIIMTVMAYIKMK